MFKKKEIEGFLLFIYSVIFRLEKVKIKYLKLSAQYTTWVLNRSTCEDYLSGKKKDDTDFALNRLEFDQYERARRALLDSVKLPALCFFATIVISIFLAVIILDFSFSPSIFFTCLGASLSFWSIMFQFYNNPKNGFETALNRKMHEMISYLLAIIGMPMGVLGAILS